MTDGNRRRSSTSRASPRTARRATSTRPPSLDGPGPDARRRSASPRSRPASTRRTLGEIDSGAYVVRVSQTRPGSPRARADARARGADAGRVPAPRHERGVPRDAPRGDRRPGDRRRPAEPWTPRPRRRTRLDRPLAAAADPGAAAVAARHRAPAGVGRAARARRRAALAGAAAGDAVDGARATAVEVAGMLAARDRAAGSAARAALLRGDRRPRSGSTATPRPRRRAMPLRQRRLRRDPPNRGPPPRATTGSTPSPAAKPPPASNPVAADSADTLARLRDAKRRPGRLTPRSRPPGPCHPPVYPHPVIPNRRPATRVPLPGVLVAVILVLAGCNDPPDAARRDPGRLRGHRRIDGPPRNPRQHVVSGDAGCDDPTSTRPPLRSTPSASTRRPRSGSTSTSYPPPARAPACPAR